MVLRIEAFVIRGELDARAPGRVRGRLWLAGLDEPVALDLAGDPRPDLAGVMLRFANPRPRTEAPAWLAGFARVQSGRAGDMTASRRVRLPDCPPGEAGRRLAAGHDHAWRWVNGLYLEWSVADGQTVVIESAGFRLDVDGGGCLPAAGEAELPDDDTPTSRAEAQADAERARQEKLLDRVQARLEREREAGGAPDFERILEEERRRLREERGEDEPESLSDADAAAQAAWIEELNAAAEDALTAYAEGEAPEGADGHPLTRRVQGRAERVRRELHGRGWVDEDAPEEHPLVMLEFGLLLAAAKLAGALDVGARTGEWPPAPLYAGDALVRLKKAREHLRDALAGLAAAAEQGLAEAGWLAELGDDLRADLAEVAERVAEVRDVLERSEEPGESE